MKRCSDTYFARMSLLKFEFPRLRDSTGSEFNSLYGNFDGFNFAVKTR